MPFFWLIAIQKVSGKIRGDLYVNQAIHKSAIIAKMPMTRGHSDLLEWPQTMSLTIIIHNNQWVMSNVGSGW